MHLCSVLCSDPKPIADPCRCCSFDKTQLRAQTCCMLSPCAANSQSKLHDHGKALCKTDDGSAANWGGSTLRLAWLRSASSLLAPMVAWAAAYLRTRSLWLDSVLSCFMSLWSHQHILSGTCMVRHQLTDTGDVAVFQITQSCY